MTPMLVARDASRRYGTHWVLRHLSFEIGAGEAVMLAGHNGSGKTTLLRMMAAALQPTLGDVSVNGASCREQASVVHRSVALLSHHSGHYDDLSAADNLRLHARVLGRDTASVGLLLEQVGLGKCAGAPVRTFSAGMKKRLQIARVMLKAPPVVLLDEPFGELDPEAMDATERWIQALRAAKTTVILATHWLDQGKRLTDRTLKLEDGKLV